MTHIPSALSKAALSSLAAGALVVGAASPASAQSRDRHRDNGVSAGEVIAGAVVLGGIAAILASSTRSNRDDRRYDSRYNGRYDNRRVQISYDDRRRGNGRRAVERCVHAAEQDARRSGYRFADVTQIRDVQRTRNGWRVSGRMRVEGNRYRSRANAGRYGGGGRYYDAGYGRGGRNTARVSDSGRFNCDISRGRISRVNYRGIRGL